MTLRVVHLLAATALLLTGSRAAVAQLMWTSGSPGLMRINSAVAGSQPIPVVNAATTYTLYTPNANRTYKMTARLNANMPNGVTLTATFDAVPGATSVGPVALNSTDRDIVVNIPRNTFASRTITYQLAALVTAGVIPSSTRTVTITLVRTS